MGEITIQSSTTKHPISMIGYEAGICYGTDTSNKDKNYKRGMDCLKSGHGRTLEFVDVFMTLDGYSAKVIREWYTHIGGSPTRLQASTRYINYQDGFTYITPKSIKSNPEAKSIYNATIKTIQDSMKQLDNLGVPREDSSMLLPLSMTTKIVDKRNLRNLIDMSHQRMCTRAYWEYRQLFSDLKNALKEYSEEWAFLVDNYFMPKCKVVGFCTEKKSCGLTPKRETNH